MWKFSVVAAAVALFAAASSPQPMPVPGGVHLLAGYRHIPEHGYDSSVGEISKDGGLKISYDIALAGKRPVDVNRLSAGLTWYREQRIGGRTIICGRYRDSGSYVVGLPGAGFYADVHTAEEMADFLLTALTFDDSEPGQHR